nr:MAG: polyprotein [Chalinolobus tuberculatus picornavirus]
MEFLNKVNKVANTLLENPKVEEQENTSDRMSASTTNNTANIVQAAVRPGAPLDAQFDNTDRFQSMAYSEKTASLNVSKLVPIGHFNWGLNDANGNQRWSLDLPQGMYPSHQYPSWGVAKYHRYVRTSFHFCLQVNAVQGSSGSLLFVYIPKIAENDGIFDFNSYLNLPHVILNIATMTQADLFIPYVYHRNFAGVWSNDLGDIRCYVWTKLNVPSGAITNVSANVLGCLVEPNFQCPLPFASDQGKNDTTKFKWSRPLINIADGVGILNLSNRMETCGARSVALVGERVLYDHATVGVKKRIRDIVQYVRVPSLIGHFEWNVSHDYRHILWQHNMVLADIPNFHHLSDVFQFYRGSLVFILSVYATPLAKGRLRMCIYPNYEKAYEYEACMNSVNTICDIGLNSTFEMTLPFTSAAWMKQTDLPLGRLQVFVETNLVGSSASATTVWCTLAVKAGDDFAFISPREGRFTIQGLTSWGSEMDLVDPLDEADTPETIEVQNKSFNAETMEYEDSEQKAAEVGLASAENAGTQNDVIAAAPPMNINYKKARKRVTTVSHTLVDNLFGRAQKMYELPVSSKQIISQVVAWPTKHHLSLGRLFAYFAGEVNFHIANGTDGQILAVHTYDLRTITHTDLSSSGAVLIPPKSTVTICAPWYSELPFRPTRAFQEVEKPLGTLWFKPEATSGSIFVYMSIRNPNFAFPLPAPRRATARTIMETLDGRLSISSPDMAKEVADLYAVGDDSPYECMIPTISCPLINMARERIGYKRDLLKMCGDIESNPGPCPQWNQGIPSDSGMPNAFLVYKERGFYKHYGVLCNGRVYHLQSDNILDAAISGKAVFTCVDADDDWRIDHQLDLDYFTAVYLDASVGSSHIFSATTNCETIVRDMFPNIPGIDQAKALGLAGLIICAASSLAYTATQISASDLKTMFQMSSQGNEGGMQAMVQKILSYCTSVFTEALASDIIRIIVKFLVRLLCYVTMYCHAPNMLTSVCLGTLLVMDVMDSKQLSSGTVAMFKSLLEGDVRSFAENVVEHIQYDTSEEEVELKTATIKAAAGLFSDIQETNQSPIKDFNAVSLAAKNAEWWVKIFKAVVDFFRNLFSPSAERKAFQWIENNTQLVCDLLHTVNTHIVDMKKPENMRDPRYHEKHVWLCRRMEEVCNIIHRSATHSPLTSQTVRLATELFKIKLPKAGSATIFRMEPVGVWITGDPGQGKSFLTHALIKAIQRKYRLVGVFTHPTGSEFMDGYSGQDVHIIDDAGQNREERDLALLCQCVSSVPFTVPMADLADKGSQYTSKLVIATTNKSDFTSTVLSDTQALKRRFPFYFRLRAKQQFQKAGKLDTALAMTYMKTGEPWEISTDGYAWRPCNVEEIAGEIAAELAKRENAVSAWRKLIEEDQGCIEDEVRSAYQRTMDRVKECSTSVDDLIDDIEQAMTGYDSPFECLRLEPNYKMHNAPQTLLDWFKKKFNALKKWSQRNLGWLTVVSILTTAASLLATFALLRKKEKPVEDNRAYNPQTTNPKGKFVLTTTPSHPIQTNQHNQSPFNGEIEHLFQNTIYISGENVQYPIHALALHGRTILTYGHVADALVMIEKPTIWYKGLVFEVDKAEMRMVTSNGDAMDLVEITLPSFPVQFKDVRKYITGTLGPENYLIFSSPIGRIMYEVKNSYLSGMHMTVEGTRNAETITYGLASKKGMCGGVLITRNNGNFQIIGMHISGNGVVGSAAMLRLFQKPENQGMIVSTEKSLVVVHQPTKTKLHPNYLHGLWDVTMEPAVLSPNDPRLEVCTDSVVKMNANIKYIGNVFNPDMPTFKLAVSQVAAQLYRLVGQNGCITIEQAVKGFDRFQAIDLNTSAGIKYRPKNKKQLISLEPYYLDPQLEQDVQDAFDQLKAGKDVETIFSTHLKDELRKKDKVKAGNTRVIEACSVDYTIVHRMVMGVIYDKLYRTPCQLSGLAVGMNPWTDFDMMVRSLFDNNLCFDFSKWDGSLSPEIMEAGTWVLSTLHENPYMVQNLMKPVITSVQVCLDQVHTVYGGMPSGAPCTTVLNSVVNLIISRYAALRLGVDVLPITYGDDLIWSTPDVVDPAAVIKIWREEFGMVATGPAKDDNVPVLEPLKVEFLKRTPAYFPNSGLIVGKLQLDNLCQHIMWSKSEDTFLQQLASFENELVLHGQVTYTKIQLEVNAVLAQHNIHMLPFEIAYRRMVSYVFE